MWLQTLDCVWIISYRQLTKALEGRREAMMHSSRVLERLDRRKTKLKAKGKERKDLKVATACFFMHETSLRDIFSCGSFPRETGQGYVWRGYD